MYYIKCAGKIWNLLMKPKYQCGQSRSPLVLKEHYSGEWGGKNFLSSLLLDPKQVKSKYVLWECERPFWVKNYLFLALLALQLQDWCDQDIAFSWLCSLKQLRIHQRGFYSLLDWTWLCAQRFALISHEYLGEAVHWFRENLCSGETTPLAVVSPKMEFHWKNWTTYGNVEILNYSRKFLFHNSEWIFAI